MENDRLHILHLIYSFKTGGVESMLIDIANTQVRMGHRVSVLVVNDVANESLFDEFDPAVEVIRMRRKEGDKPLLMMARLNWRIMRLRPDVIHSHHHKFSRLVVVRASRLLFTVHCKDVPMIYASRSHMVAITDTVRDDVLARVPGADVTTILNGFRTADVPRRGRRPAGDVFHIVQVGSLRPEYKGQDVLVRALRVLADRGVRNVDVTFIGRGDELGPLEELARKEGVADRVNFAGQMDRAGIYASLHTFDAMVHPSRSEGFGLTVAEGMAAGLPLVLTRGDGPWEVAGNGRYCISAESGDPVSVADAITELMTHYSEALDRAGDAAAYVARYDVSATVEQYIAYYRRLLEKQ